jgi:hypothetical protein
VVVDGRVVDCHVFVTKVKAIIMNTKVSRKRKKEEANVKKVPVAQTTMIDVVWAVVVQPALPLPVAFIHAVCLFPPFAPASRRPLCVHVIVSFVVASLYVS